MRIAVLAAVPLAAIAILPMLPARAHADDVRPMPADLDSPEARSPRPARASVGLGLGFAIPASLLDPTLTSVRFRLASGLTFEPLLSLAHDTSTEDDGMFQITDIVDDIQVALDLRAPIASRGRVDLSLLADLAYRVSTSDPDGADNAQRTGSTTIGYGLGLDYWLDRHWDVSLTAGNPLLRSTSTSRKNGTGVPEVSSRQTFLGAIFDPSLSVMIHLYL